MKQLIFSLYFQRIDGGATFHSLLIIRLNSFVARCKIRSLLVAEVTLCKNLLVTRCKVGRCKIHSLLIAKFARYMLHKLLFAKTYSLLVAKFTRYSLQKLLVAKFARYSLKQITCYSMQKIIHHSLKQSQVHKVRWKFSFFNTICWSQKIKSFSSQCIKLKSVVSRKISYATIYKWVKAQKLLALNQKNK